MAPVRPGDVVRAEVTVLTIDYAKRRVTLDCRCTVGDMTVLKGEATVLAPQPQIRLRGAFAPTRADAGFPPLDRS